MKSQPFSTLFFMLVALLLLTWQLTPSSSAQESETERPLLFAHYMPWYQTPEISGSWGWHWTMNHFSPAQVDENGQREIASHYTPLTGAYDSHDEAVLEYQVLLMKLSGIDGVIVDWYGTENFRDYATLNTATLKLFEATQRAGLQFALAYEDATVVHMTNENYLQRDAAVEHGREMMNYANRWFSAASYLHYEGQPLLFVFGPQYFRSPSDWEGMFADLDPTPVLVTLDGHMDWAARSSYPWMPMHLAGGAELIHPVLESYLTLFYRNARRRDFVVGTAFPAFHDIYEEAGVRSSYGYLDAKNGDTLRLTLDMALAMNPFVIQLATWNDYGEGTMIEPTEETGYQYLEIVQGYRQNWSADFTFNNDDLRLPFELYQARKAHQDDTEINTQLDAVFAAIIAGDLDLARNLLNELPFISQDIIIAMGVTMVTPHFNFLNLTIDSQALKARENTLSRPKQQHGTQGC